jgi:hypothetical protein
VKSLQKHELQEKSKNNLAFKTVHHIDSDDDEEEVEKDIALITRQFQKKLRNKQGKKRFLNFKKDGNKKESSKEALRCYKCNKT